MRPLISYRDRVKAYFEQHEGRWIPAIEFESIGGRQGWRTRISQCRTQCGMPIANRIRWVKRPDGTGYRLSEYRFVRAFQLSA